MLKRLLRQYLAIGCLTLLTTACGGGGGGGSGSSAETPTPPPSSSPTPTPPGTSRSVHLSWTAPTTRADGSPLAASALAGYRLFYTRDDSSSSEDTALSISGGTTTSTDVSLATGGTYTFAITAIDTTGGESALSAPVSITVN